MKNILIVLSCSLFYSTGFSQIPLNDNNWILNSYFSDEFNGTRNSNWQLLNPAYDQWGQEIFRDQNTGYGTEGAREFIRFTGEAEDSIYYSGGIQTGFETGDMGLGYGEYEVEARLIETPGIQSGLWPAFWTAHGAKPPIPPNPNWYEEIDIFEPGSCMIDGNWMESGYWYPIDDNVPEIRVKEAGSVFGIDFSQWHKYSVEWSPEKLIFYFDDVEFFRVLGPGITPDHENTNLYIDLQVDYNCPPDTTNGLLGYYDVNYFKYYELNCNNEVITSTQGNNYNFNNYVHNIKQSCIFENTSIPNNLSISIRATDFVEFNEGFEVPIGSTLYVDVNPCQ